MNTYVTRVIKVSQRPEMKGAVGSLPKQGKGGTTTTTTTTTTKTTKNAFGNISSTSIYPVSKYRATPHQVLNYNTSYTKRPDTWYVGTDQYTIRVERHGSSKKFDRCASLESRVRNWVERDNFPGIFLCCAHASTYTYILATTNSLQITSKVVGWWRVI